MRIVAGELGGRRLVTPRGRGTRPTADRVREAVFAILGPLDGVDVLDLFAGSGALGIEALSRGAASVTLVERAPQALAAIRANLAALRVEDRARVVAGDWRRAVAAEQAAGRRFGLCLLDPPYSLLPRLADDLAMALEPLLAPGAALVVEGSARDPILPEPLTLPIASRTDRTYGDTAVCVLRMEA